MISLRKAAASAMILTAGGCFSQFGEYLPDQAGGGGDAGSGGAPLTGCTSGGYCVSPPFGWEGPVALTVPGGACGGGFEALLATGQTDLAGAPATCDCTCGAASGSTCPTATVTRYTDVDCTGTAYPALAVGACTFVSGSATSWNASATPVGGSCPPTEGKQVPAATWNDRALCGLGAPAACEGGSCAPIPGAGLEPRLCIYETGDVACDAEQFPNKVLLFTGGHDDTRDCDAPCACGEPAGAACVGFVRGFQGGTCQTPQDGVNLGTCDADYVDGNGSLDLYITSVDEGACTALPRAPAGTVTGLEPLTVCCTATFE